MSATAAPVGSRAVLDELRRLAPVIRSLAAVHQIERVRAFGSVARREETAESDIDLLVRRAEDGTYFDFAGFALDMELLMGRHVDVTSESGLHSDRHQEILQEAVEL